MAYGITSAAGVIQEVVLAAGALTGTVRSVAPWESQAKAQCREA